MTISTIVVLLLSAIPYLHLQAQSLTNSRPLKLFSSGSPINSITLQGPTTFSSAYTLTMPASAPALNQLLISDGSGNLNWGQISNAQIVSGAAIDYNKLNLTNSIQNSDVVANAITTSKVANGTVTTSKMADSAISGLKLLTFAVTNRHLASGAVTNDKVSGTGASTGNVLTYNGSSVVWAAPSGGGSSGIQFDKLSNSFTVSSSSPTYADVVSVNLAAGKTYRIEAWVLGIRSGATSAACTGRLFYSGQASTDYGMGLFFGGAFLAGTAFNNNALFDTEAGGQSILMSSVVNAKIIYSGYITTTTSGTLTVQTARATSNSTDNFIVREGSYIIATPLD